MLDSSSEESLAALGEGLENVLPYYPDAVPLEKGGNSAMFEEL